MKTQIKNLIKEVLLAVIVLISGVILGFTIPTTISFIIAILTEFTFIECTSSVIFWVFSLIGTAGGYCYINHVNKL